MQSLMSLICLKGIEPRMLFLFNTICVEQLTPYTGKINRLQLVRISWMDSVRNE